MDGNERDQKLAALFTGLSDRARRGEVVDIESHARAHPELADELRSLWSLASITDDVAEDGRESVADSSSATITTDPSGRIAGVARSRPPDEKLPERIGDYEILEEIGRGGMGAVYRARQSRLGRVVALKAVLSGTLASETERTRFRVETEAAAAIEHPNIVPLFDVGEHAGTPFFTMQLVEGENLAKRLSGGPLTPSEAVSLLIPVCRAVDHAHRLGVLHRDLKPANILLEPDPDRPGGLRPWVTDFGLAKRVGADESLTASGAILGTPSYMSPEQASGRLDEISRRSDVYSLGAILYHALTGRPPFQSTSPVGTILQVIEQDPLPPRLLNPQIDRELEWVVLRCLQKPPDMRYSSAGALADDLEAYLKDEPLSARSGSFAQVIARMFRETHHAAVLENWGLLWMWHSLVLLLMCLFTNWLHYRGVRASAPYLTLWTVGLGAWAGAFWGLRRRGGPVTFVERQIAHVWGGSVISVGLLTISEILMGLDVLALTPLLSLIGGTVFFVKAGILTGRFYVQAAALYLTVIPSALFPDFAHSIFGVVGALCFFVPGWQYWRQRARGRPIRRSGTRVLQPESSLRLPEPL